MKKDRRGSAPPLPRWGFHPQTPQRGVAPNPILAGGTGLSCSQPLTQRILMIQAVKGTPKFFLKPHKKIFEASPLTALTLNEFFIL